MIRRFSTAVMALVLLFTAGLSLAQPAKIELAGDALANPDLYFFMDVQASWNLMVGPIEKLAALPAIKGDPAIGPQANMLLTAMTTEITRPFAAFGMDPLHDIKSISLSATFAGSDARALVVMRGDFSKSRLGDLLKSAGDRTEALNGKELHLAGEIPMGSATFVPAYYLTATEWVLGDVATVRAAANAKNFQAGKVKGAAVAAMVAKPALALGLNMGALRASWVGPMLGLDEAIKTAVGMFDEVSLGMSEKEFKLTFRTQDQKIAAGALDIANGINEWMKMIPSLVKGAGFMLLGANTLVPEEMPDEVQGLFQDRKSFLQLVDAVASLVKASGSATLKGDRFDWRIQGTVGSAAVLGVLAGAAWFLAASSSSEPEPYIERAPVYENPSDDENERVLEEPIPEEGSDLAPVPE